MAAWSCTRSTWTGRPATRCRSARPRSAPSAPRRTRSSSGARVELPREESRRRLEDLVGSAEFPVLSLELGDARSLFGAEPGPVPAVDLGLADPLAEGLRADVELPGDAGDVAVVLARLPGRLENQPHGPVAYLRRVPLAGRVLVLCHGSILSKVWSLHKTRGDSVWSAERREQPVTVQVSRIVFARESFTRSMGRPRPYTPQMTAVAEGRGEGAVRRYLVVANLTLGGEHLRDKVRACLAAGPS